MSVRWLSEDVVSFEIEVGVHVKCSDIKISMYKVMRTFVCRGCVKPATGTGCTHTHTHTHIQSFYGSLDFVRDNLGEPVPEETFTHSHLLWSSVIPYLLPPSITIHGIIPVQFTCLND